MTPEQFKSLANIYGADLKRWPEHHQVAATALTNQDSVRAESALKQANLIDDALDSYMVCTDRKLADLIISNALHSKPTREFTKESSNWWWGNVLWPSIGFASVGIAGALAGVFCISLLTSTMSTPEINDGSNGTADVIDFGTDWS